MDIGELNFLIFLLFYIDRIVIQFYRMKSLFYVEIKWDYFQFWRFYVQLKVSVRCEIKNIEIK